MFSPADKSTFPIMWEKGKEIASYAGHTFEVAAAGVRTPQAALALWRRSPLHLDVLLNRGLWKEARWQWKAAGAALADGFACAWFGAAPG